VQVLRNPVGRARAWIRQVLNNRILDECILSLAKEEKLMVAFYATDSIMRNFTEAEIFATIARSLKAIPFVLSVENRGFNVLPKWLETVIASEVQIAKLQKLPSCYARKKSVDPPVIIEKII